MRITARMKNHYQENLCDKKKTIFYRNPTPPEQKNALYWPPSGKRGVHYEIKLKPRVGPRPLRPTAKALQKLRIGQLPILNDCSMNDIFG